MKPTLYTTWWKNKTCRDILCWLQNNMLVLFFYQYRCRQHSYRNNVGKHSEQCAGASGMLGTSLWNKDFRFYMVTITILAKNSATKSVY